MTQLLIVSFLFAVAVIYLFRKLKKEFSTNNSSKSSCQGCGCSQGVTNN